MIDLNTISSNVETITQNDYDKILILAKKAKTELLYQIDKNEDEIEDKYIDIVEDLIEDMTIYKLNTLEKQGIESEKFDVIQINYTENNNYPTILQNKINSFVNKINLTSSSQNFDYATLNSPFLS